MGKMISFDSVSQVRRTLEESMFVFSGRYIYDGYIIKNISNLDHNKYPTSLYDKNAPSEDKLGFILPCAYLLGNTLNGVCWLEFLHSDNWFVESSHLKIKEALDLKISC